MTVQRAAVALAVAVLAGVAGMAAAVGQPAGAPPSAAVTVTALAVAEDASGTFVGVHATVEAQVLGGGNGDVFVSTKPLAQTDMQGSARLAARVAAGMLGVDWRQHDYLVAFRSESTVIGGPSAGAVMALALMVALHNLLEPSDPWSLDPSVAATGTINPDGTIGPVGGIPAKAEGAQGAGIRHFLYPAGMEVAATQAEGRTVTVDMDEHCADLGIECSAAASLVDVLHAAGIDVLQPAAPVPGTTDYRDDLEPSVQRQVEALRGRLDALADRVADAGLGNGARAAVQEERVVAEQRLAEATEALAGERFYLAATRAFQGHIQAGRAENLTSFHAADGQAGQRAVVAEALDGCEAAAAQAGRIADGLDAAGINALYAIGSAQQRAAQARELRDQAREGFEQARFLDDWIGSLFASTFCVERAGTAAWWADLRGTFGAGPPLGDRDVLVADALEAAREDVAYATAVLGDAAVLEAAARLQQAGAHAAAGRADAAVLEAVEAQTAATVAMQTAGGAPVPEAVLQAAVQSASLAIDTARSQGVEPMLSVSLVELSREQNQTAQALGNLWSARSLALLDRAPAPAGFGSGNGGDADGGVPLRAIGLGAAALLGAVVGGLAVAAIFAIVLAARRR